MMDLSLCLKQITLTCDTQSVDLGHLVQRLALAHGVNGWVLLHSRGLAVEVEGSLSALDSFLLALAHDAPRMARIGSFVVTDDSPIGYTRFDVHCGLIDEAEQAVRHDSCTFAYRGNMCR